MDIQIIPAYDRTDEIAALFTEYTDLLVSSDSAFAAYLEKQNYDAELLHPEEKYAPPGGRLYAAYCGGELAGCIALHRLDGDVCEMKRLYVRSRFREQHIGSQLVRRIIDEAREIGYSSMVLDTLPFLKAAINLYKKLGFREIESYNNSPMEGLVYMRLEL